MDRQAADVVADELDLAGMDGSPDLEAQRRGGTPDGTGAGERPGRRVEPGEEAVAGRLDLDAAVSVDRHARRLVVRGEQVLPPAVPNSCGHVGRADDVGE